MAPDPPPEYGPDFLAWLRKTTEAAWQQVEESSLDDYRTAGFIGATWRRGTRWTGPLGDDTIAQARTALRRSTSRRSTDCSCGLVHSTTPWMRGAAYGTGDLALYQAPGFYDWLHDEEPIRAALGEVADTSLFAEEIDVHHGGRRWLEGGPSPQLLPIFGHRYVVGDDSECGALDRRQRRDRVRRGSPRLPAPRARRRDPANRVALTAAPSAAARGDRELHLRRGHRPLEQGRGRGRPVRPDG